MPDSKSKSDQTGKWGSGIVKRMLNKLKGNVELPIDLNDIKVEKNLPLNAEDIELAKNYIAFNLKLEKLYIFDDKTGNSNQLKQAQKKAEAEGSVSFTVEKITNKNTILNNEYEVTVNIDNKPMIITCTRERIDFFIKSEREGLEKIARANFQAREKAFLGKNLLIQMGYPIFNGNTTEDRKAFRDMMHEFKDNKQLLKGIIQRQPTNVLGEENSKKVSMLSSFENAQKQAQSTRGKEDEFLSTCIGFIKDEINKRAKIDDDALFNASRYVSVYSTNFLNNEQDSSPSLKELKEILKKLPGSADIKVVTGEKDEFKIIAVPAHQKLGQTQGESSISLSISKNVLLKLIELGRIETGKRDIQVELKNEAQKQQQSSNTNHAKLSL